MSKKMTVLVVDDEKHIRLALDYNLRNEGFKVCQAQDGVEGLEIAKKKKPDLIILDWMMPRMDGIQTLHALRRDKDTKDIPVFMFTAKGTLEDVDRGFDVGADGYITKPFDVWKIGKYILEKLEKIGRLKAVAH
jgi:DNA-binding response OmpR family regulator